MIIAIDGPGGSGKSTIASEIARRYGFTKLDTGAMYRSVAYLCAQAGIDLDDERAVSEAARKMHFFFDTTGAEPRLWVNGQDVSRHLHTPEVDAIVSKVSAYPAVRIALLGAQRGVANRQDVVAEGRDIGTVVFPHAELKIFLTADPRERARRRVLQLHEGEELDPAALEAEVDEALAALNKRDEADSHRKVAPLVAAEDAVHIDSSASTVEEVVETIGALIEERRA